MNRIKASRMEFRKLNTLYKDLKIEAQLVNCNFFVSGDAVPEVQGAIFSPCRSLKNMGASIMMLIITANMSMEVVKSYLFNSQVPNASVVEMAMIFEPHIKPLARACWLIGMISTAIPSVATSWKAPKNDTAKPAAIKRFKLFNGSGT